MRGALTRYRVMAVVVGIGLAVLVLVGVPLQIAGHDGVETWVGVVHGWVMYPLYLLASADLYRRTRKAGGRLGPWHLLAMVCAGFVPVLAFVAERWITATIRRELPDRVA